MMTTLRVGRERILSEFSFLYLDLSTVTSSWCSNTMVISQCLRLGTNAPITWYRRPFCLSLQPCTMRCEVKEALFFIYSQWATSLVLRFT